MNTLNDFENSQIKINYIGMSSPENARDIIGFFHHNLSQHTKEISVINTTLADLIKSKIDDDFKDNVKKFIDSTETRIERLSTSFKLLTKQVFHNDSTIQNLIDKNYPINSENNNNEIYNNLIENQKKLIKKIKIL